MNSEVNTNGVNKYTELFTQMNAYLEGSIMVIFTMLHICFLVRDNKAHHFEIQLKLH